MKLNKKGFISVSVIYSFFIVFLLIMLSMLASYINKSFLADKIVEAPIDIIPNEDCDGKTISECIKVVEKKKKNCTGDSCFEFIPGGESGECKSDSNPTTSLSKLNVSSSCLNPGLYRARDDCYDKDSISYVFSGEVENNYATFGGYLWRIVRINGDGTVRLIYAGELDSEGNVPDNLNAYVTIKGIYDSGLGQYLNNWKNQSFNKIRYNYFWILGKSAEACNANMQRLENDRLDPGSEDGSAGIYSRQEIADCTTAVFDSKNAYENLAGGILLWNIGYMNNHTHNPLYDSLFDNQNSSELKTFVDYWYEGWQTEKNGVPEQYIAKEEIFCGEKNLTKGNGFLSYVDGKYEFSSYQRLGGDSGVSSPKGAMLSCQPTGEKATDGSAITLGTKVKNFGNYSAGNPTLIYENVNKLSSECTKEIQQIICESKVIKFVKEVWGTINPNYEDTNCSTQTVQVETEDGCSGTGKTTFYKTSNTYTLKSRAEIYGTKLEKQVGNGQLDYAVGLLSADEAVFAGARLSGNCPSYLDDEITDTGKEFWTMTIAYTKLGDNDGARYYVVEKTNSGTKISLKDDTSITTTSAGAYIRPVINVSNLTSDQYCANGKDPGTKGNPYRLGESCSS